MRKPSQPHCVLEQELQSLLRVQRTLVKNKSTLVVEPCQEAEKEVRDRVRAIKNRLAAKRSRDQARTYVQKLESSLSHFVSHNETLSQRLALSESDKELLRAENRNLKRQVAELTLDLQRASAEVQALTAAELSKELEVPRAGEAGGILAGNLSPQQACQVPLCSYEALGDFAESAAFVSVEEWRKEKRRRQNREAQRRHRERQLCLHNKNIPMQLMEKERKEGADGLLVKCESSEASSSPEQQSDDPCSLEGFNDDVFDPPGGLAVSSVACCGSFVQLGAQEEQEEAMEAMGFDGEVTYKSHQDGDRFLF